VRDLAGEALLVAPRRRDPAEQVVQRRRQPGQLVAPRPQVEALIEVVRAPRRRIARHRRHRPQRTVHRRADREEPGEHEQRGDDDRAEQDGALEALDRRDRQADDDRADLTPVAADRLRA
jgi:hypothetical protein